jgi:hypothetical protein
MTTKLHPPPWWVKLPLYMATGPWPESRDMRVNLHRRYLRAQKTSGLKAANRLARREAVTYTLATAERLVWGVVKAIRWIGVFG